MSSAQGHRRHDAHVHHRRVIDGALQDLSSRAWSERNAAISKIFRLLHDEPHLSQYHRAQICGLLAKHGDDADLEISEYAVESIGHAQEIIIREGLPRGLNSRLAIEDLINDARDTLRARCPEIELPEDIMESMDGEWESSEQDMLGDDRDGRDELATEDEDEDYEEPDEEEDETDNADEDQDYDAESCTCSTTSNAMEIDNTLAIVPTPGPSATLAHHASQLPSHYALARGSSSTGAPGGFEEFAFDVDPENIRLLGLILMLVIKDRDDMEANVLAYARGRGWSDEDIGEMVREAFVPKTIVPPQPQGPIGGDLTLRLKKPGD